MFGWFIHFYIILFYFHWCACVSPTLPGRVGRAEVFALVTPLHCFPLPLRCETLSGPSKWEQGRWGPNHDGTVVLRLFKDSMCVCCQTLLVSIRGPAYSSWDMAVSSQLTTVPAAPSALASGGSPAQSQNQELYHLPLKRKGLLRTRGAYLFRYFLLNVYQKVIDTVFSACVQSHDSQPEAEHSGTVSL